MTYPTITNVNLTVTATLVGDTLGNVAQLGQEFSVTGADNWCEVDENGDFNGVPLGQSGPFIVQIDAEYILCVSFRDGVLAVFDDEGVNGRAYSSTSIASHSPGTVVTLIATAVQSVSTGGGGGSVQWVDLGLVDLVSAIMDGPTTLFDMPDGSFLSSIRATDDPATVALDSYPGSGTVGNIAFIQPTFSTVKGFGWGGFAYLPSADSFHDTLYLPAAGGGGGGYGPFAALDTGITDFQSIVLSAAVVGPIQAALLLTDSGVGVGGYGAGVRVDAITAWAANTNYDSPASNTLATPGALQKCAILANGTIWINDGLTGTSGGSAPDFAGNAGGSVSDGADIVWYDTTSPPPTVGAVHVVAEIVTPVSP